MGDKLCSHNLLPKDTEKKRNGSLETHCYLLLGLKSLPLELVFTSNHSFLGYRVPTDDAGL